MKEVKVTWKAFGDKPQIGRFVSSVEFKLPVSDKTDLAICEEIFKQTNLYQGTWWSLLIQPLLSQTRTHTALSVGDEVEIDGVAYICADLGFIKVSDAEVRKFPDGTIWSVLKKEEVAS
jgi:hypothetical protein